MLDLKNVINSWSEYLTDTIEEIFGYSIEREQVDEWMERVLYIAEGTSVRPGPYRFDFTPYMREIVKVLHDADPTRFVSIMKDGQSGFTTALVVGGMLYIIDVSPDGILFTAGDQELAKMTIEDRFDPVVRSSKLEHRIRPNVIKKTNNRTGDTAKKKEFSGGTMVITATSNPNSFRMYSSKFIFADDYDTAPKKIGKEGSPKMVMKTRQNSYGDRAKTFMISTPTVTQTSNIWEQVQLGTMEYWNWPCPACDQWIKIEWKTECPDGTLAGMVWKLDEDKQLIPESIRYKCPHCSHLIEEKEKYDLNLKGKWIATVDKPKEARHRSFLKNALYNPPGFDGWLTFVREWLAANPPGERSDSEKLRSFNNLRLGLPFAELGESINISGLMENTRAYLPGVVPDQTSERDGNGPIIMLTLACDVNGVMNPPEDPKLEDVRLDWEVLAHSAKGVTYSVDHGSIGTFKRMRDRTREEIALDVNRDKWTITHGLKFSVWPAFEEILRKNYPTESSIESQAKPGWESTDKPNGMNVMITACDTGFGSNQVMQFVQSINDMFVFGVKGRVEENYRKLVRDTQPVKRSAEKPRHLYIVEVNQVKDDLAQYMKLRQGEDDSFPPGYMNFPEPRDGKYTKKSYFSHYEGELRTEVKNDVGDVIGFQWKKKNNQVQNHFWDVRVYNLVAPLMMLDKLKQSNPSKYKNFTWEDFVLWLTGGE